MPSISVHLTIAAHMAERLGIKDLPSYFLGNIAPDAVNADGFASAEKRYSAHIRSKDYAVWKQNIKSYKAEHEAAYEKNADFFKGFLLHLYTDIAWDEAVQPQLFSYLRSQGFSEDELNERKWDELRGFDAILSKRDEYVSAIRQLKNASPLPITTVTSHQLKKWLDFILSLTYDYPPAKYLSCCHIKAAEEQLGKYI